MTASPQERNITGPRSYLSLCDEWFSTTGGISAFNRDLMSALAAAGQRVACVVNSPSDAEVDDACRRGVTLLAAEQTPTGPELLVPVTEALRFTPEVVIGHDRISAAAAWAYARKFLDARLVHIVHTAPSEIERFQSARDATRIIERKELVTRTAAQDADLVAAVGPRLTRHTISVLEDGLSAVSVLRLDPGLPDSMYTGIRRPPARPLVLVLGRTSDVELKGIDIAARAVAALPPTTLLVRGAPSLTCDQLHRELTTSAALPRERLDVRPFTAHHKEIQRDLSRSAVCVMPSRAEGFGLSALDAIAAGTPVLVSARSGVAELLHAKLGRMADPMIVDVRDSMKRDVLVWKSAIAQILDDQPTAFQYAADICERLSTVLTWRDAATALIDRLNCLS